MKQKEKKTPPTLEQLKRELKRERYRRSYGETLSSTVFSLVVVAALAILVATLLLPVFQIYGESMAPNLKDGEIVVSVKTGKPEQGDMVAFYYNNKILIKRVIATSGQWVDIDDEGTVYINGEPLEEPYLEEKDLGECDIELPYQVPDGRWFVMGDARATSVDSRDRALGCVSEEQIVGRLVYRIWPLEAVTKFG